MRMLDKQENIRRGLLLLPANELLLNFEGRQIISPAKVLV
jgi:hypothetical protein